MDDLYWTGASKTLLAWCAAVHGSIANCTSKAMAPMLQITPSQTELKFWTLAIKDASMHAHSHSHTAFWVFWARHRQTSNLKTSWTVLPPEKNNPINKTLRRPLACVYRRTCAHLIDRLSSDPQCRLAHSALWYIRLNQLLNLCAFSCRICTCLVAARVCHLVRSLVVHHICSCCGNFLVAVKAVR